MVSIIICQIYGYMDNYHLKTIMMKTDKFKVPVPPTGSDDLCVVNDNNDENKGQNDQPTNQPTTVTGTRVPQDVLADESTTMRTTPNSATGTENTKTKWQDLKKD